MPGGRMCVAALTQMLPVESAELQLSLVANLAQFDKTPADKKAVTLALVRMAVFAQEPAIRQAAIDMLKKRDAHPADGMLLHGLRYPWPSIARNAAETIVQLQRKDLVPELIKMLEVPDPRDSGVRRRPGDQGGGGARAGSHRSSAQLLAVPSAAAIAGGAQGAFAGSKENAGQRPPE